MNSARKAIKDCRSGRRAVKVELSLEAFARALTGAYQDCDFSFNETGIIGKNKEQKTVVIPEIEGWGLRPNKEILAHMVKDDDVNDLFLAGWIPRYDDFQNSLNRTGDGYNVLFERWV